MNDEDIATLELGKAIFYKLLDRVRTETPVRIDLEIDHKDPIDKLLTEYSIDELLSSGNYTISYNSRTNSMKVKIDYL